ncbi:class I SAM-dependent methyltransferase [Paenibacillus agilis]|uniref:Methyltransferase domain-containing protein n=1 Tax=Paenibacillus agilis TaxID=3020863 RepID=A0A559J125_9BACL|nr:methyltransferase domain-containing protein [Paenibacillus agilis]TVX93553.1 methyltransferase domain-containing protein [Paenibacillus agilis]
MKTEWDYTEMARTYLKRPDYAKDAIQKMIQISNVKKSDLICDIGAGAGHLTVMLTERGFQVCAVEPNESMATHGKRRTQLYNPKVLWINAIAENTSLSNDQFQLVTFGSSFNVTNQSESLVETNRILKRDGWFACMWNHRNLEDEIQQQIEKIIKTHISEYDYGSRRQDQTNTINESKLFDNVTLIEGAVEHTISVSNCIDAWKSHATLHRQAGAKFEEIIAHIEDFLCSLNLEELVVPYTTKIWMARTKKG